MKFNPMKQNIITFLWDNFVNYIKDTPGAKTILITILVLGLFLVLLFLRGIFHVTAP
jgi:hypothetical protein